MKEFLSAFFFFFLFFWVDCDWTSNRINQYKTTWGKYLYRKISFALFDSMVLFFLLFSAATSYLSSLSRSIFPTNEICWLFVGPIKSLSVSLSLYQFPDKREKERKIISLNHKKRSQKFSVHTFWFLSSYNRIIIILLLLQSKKYPSCSFMIV